MEKLVLCFFCIITFVSYNECNCKKLDKQPNIIFIVADDLGWNDVSYHGSEIKTPHIDKLANQGVKLESYYVQPCCTPSRSQILSGRYQIHTGLQHMVIWPPQRNCLPIQDLTIADLLRENGYSTHAIGKWHLGYYRKECTPIYRGFDTFFGFYNGRQDYFTHIRCQAYPGDKNACGLDFHDQWKNVQDEKGDYSTNIFSMQAQKVIRNHVNNTKESKKPLFMYLPFQAVHEPLQAPASYIEPYKHIKDQSRRTYAGMANALDEGIGNITKTLKETGLYDNTIIVFTTDNGGQIHKGGNNWPLRGWKLSLWEGGIRGVGFVSSPLLKNKGSESWALMHVSDWLPTLVNLVGGNTTGMPLDGFDMWDAINEGKPSPRKEILHNIDPLWEHKGTPLYSDTYQTNVRGAIRLGDWKLITGNPGNGSWVSPPHLWAPSLKVDPPPEPKNKNTWLFNIADDPHERNDLSDAEPEIVKLLLDRMYAYNRTAVPVRYPEYDPLSNPNLHGGFWVPWVD